MEPFRREINVLTGTFVFTLALLATHLGEFWPFSVYPMFSKAGQPWTRALMVEKSSEELSEPWRSCLETAGRPDPVLCEWPVEPFHPERTGAVSMAAFGVDPIDFANYVSKTREWTRESAEAILTMTGARPESGRVWVVYKVKGRIDPHARDLDAFQLHMEPAVVFTSEDVFIRPTGLDPSTP